VLQQRDRPIAGQALTIEARDDVPGPLRFGAGQFTGAAGEGREFTLEDDRFVVAAAARPVYVRREEVGGASTSSPWLGSAANPKL